ncbi:MAG: C40 family peptidase [Gemmatimonadota bacterium]
MPWRRAATAIVLGASVPGALAAQGVAFQLGRLFTDGGWTSYQLAWSRPLLGPVALGLNGTSVRGPGAGTERLWGAGLDLSLFRGGMAGPYAVGGIGGGIGSGGAEQWWRSWSAGAGYELLPLPFLSLAAEARYRAFAPRERAGVELAIRLGATFGSSGGARPRETGAPPMLPARTVGDATVSGRALARSDAQRLVDGVLATADSAMGTRYRLGGRGENGEGFDCSGLIQYAYARHGISLPRRSTEQATQGREIGRAIQELEPGDLLTFASTGKTVTHVGMYLGNGRFIHSASAGVQTSRLSPDDSNGAWWFRRWVGARRIVE